MAFLRLFLILLILMTLAPGNASAASLPDSDGDGYSDPLELRNGYYPFGKGRPLSPDYDGDGLTDADESSFGTDSKHSDTDRDGFPDGVEVAYGYDPKDKDPSAKLQKRIRIDLKKQELTYYVGGKEIAAHLVSTGRIGMSTPPGKYRILSKHPRAWSSSSKLWMPWWMAFKGSQYGIHELPEWPNGKKEGEGHLGKPVSHGCVRLGVGPAKTLYDWADVGTEVTVVK